MPDTSGIITIRRAERSGDGRAAYTLAESGTPFLGHPSRDDRWLAQQPARAHGWFSLAEVPGRTSPLAYVSYIVEAPVRMMVMRLRSLAIASDLCSIEQTAILHAMLYYVEREFAEGSRRGCLIADPHIEQVDVRRKMESMGWEGLQPDSRRNSVRYIRFPTRTQHYVAAS